VSRTPHPPKLLLPGLDPGRLLANRYVLLDWLGRGGMVVAHSQLTTNVTLGDYVLVLDATTGQNALSQVSTFREVADITGLIMTKLDGTARGGILVACAEKFGLALHAIGVGEGIENLREFHAGEFVEALFETEQ